jgi:hypothetical protein
VTRRRLALAGFAALVAAYVWPVQPDGANQNANFALTRSLAQGSLRLDETGSGPDAIPTHDVVRFEGHWYAAKPPGLAAVSVPSLLAVEAVGIKTTGDVTRPLWLLHLPAVVFPALVLLLLVRRLGDAVEPGHGTAAALLLGVATLMLPFGTLFFVHVLAAALGFGAFALLWHERRGSQRLARVGVAGLLAGLATVVDYPLALLVFVLWPYAAAREGRLERAAVYAAGAAIGAVLVLSYNEWAFGSPLHFPYEGWREVGESARGGLFGASVPSLRVALELLFVPAGVATLTPAVIGLAWIYRRGLRAEAITIAAVTAAFLLHNAASAENPFGGASPGPRHLIPVLPFLAVPLAVAIRRLPGPTLALAGGAASVMLVYTATTPLAAWDGQAPERLLNGAVVPTVLDPLGIEGVVAMIPFFAFGLASTAAAVAIARPRLDVRQVVAGALSLGCWVGLVELSSRVLFDGSGYGPPLVLAAAAAAVALVVVVLRLELGATIARHVRDPRRRRTPAPGESGRG